MFHKRKISIAVIALIIIATGVYWRGPLVRAAMQLLRVSQGVSRTRSAPNNGLVGYWNFDECDNCTTAADKSGSGNTGTVNDANASGLRNRVGGKINQALSFDGTDDYVAIKDATGGDNTSDISTNAFTVGAWANFDAPVATTRVIMSKHDPSGQLTSDYALYFHPALGYCGGAYDNKFAFSVQSGTASYLRFSVPFANLSGWHYVVGTYDGVEQNLYIDGVLQNGIFHTAGCSAASVPATRNRVATIETRLGGFVNSSIAMKGELDEVRLYNRALSADEILRLYEEGSYRATINANQNSMMANGLVGMWSFNGPDVDWSQASAEARDVSGQGNHGNVTNFGKEAARPGIVGQALSFDGVDDYVSVGDSAVYNVGTALTYSAWIKTTDAQGEIFSHFDATSPFTGTLFGLGFLDNDGQLEAWFCDGVSCPTSGATSARVADTGTAVNDGSWHHVAVTYDGTNARFYRDGILSSTIATTNSVGDSTNNLNIGRDTNTSPTRYFNGLIDDLRMYNRTLNAAEVQELYLSSARL